MPIRKHYLLIAGELSSWVREYEIPDQVAAALVVRMGHALWRDDPSFNRRTFQDVCGFRPCGKCRGTGEVDSPSAPALHQCERCSGVGIIRKET